MVRYRAGAAVLVALLVTAGAVKMDRAEAGPACEDEGGEWVSSDGRLSCRGRRLPEGGWFFSTYEPRLGKQVEEMLAELPVHVRSSLEAYDAGDVEAALLELDAIEEKWRWMPYEEPEPPAVRIARYVRERILEERR